MHHQGWAYIADRDTGVTMELFNDARTLDGLIIARNAGDVDGFPYIGNDILCESYRWVPDCGTVPGTPSEVTFSLPDVAPEAPWCDEAFPASADAYGFIVTEWTGLDGAHVSSSSTGVGFAGGGSTVGVRGAAGRTMAINVMLLGRSDEALEHLFRWLESTLNSVCDQSSSVDMLIRRFCPEVIGDPWWGIGRVERVALIGGLTWEQPPSPEGQCRVRLVNFTLQAQDPCIYVNHEAEEAVGTFAPAVSEVEELGYGTTQPRCEDAAAFATTLETVYVEVERTSVGVLAPIIELELQPVAGVISGGPTLVQVYADIDGSGVFSCSLTLLAEFGIRAIDATEELAALTLIYDGARRDFFQRRPSVIGISSGWGWVTPTGAGVSRWGQRRCHGFHIAIMPLAPELGVPPDIEVSVTIGERISCP